MLSRHFIHQLTKTRHVVHIQSVQDFNTGNRLMERVPRNIKICEQLQPTDTPKSSEDTEPKAKTDTSFIWVNPEAPPVKTFSLFDIKGWWEFNVKLTCEKNQAYNEELIKKAGNNLAAAYFVLQWNGKVKFKDSDDWIINSKDKVIKLPATYQPKYIITAIDASNTYITYEGLRSMSNLTWLKWLSFKGSRYIDDWCVDKISANYPSLEYLDISDCKNVTERGVEALYKSLTLKTLIVTNHHKSAAFDLTCLMLEDCNPNLKCKIFNPKYYNKPEDRTEKDYSNYKL